MDKYELETPELKKRTERNKELYHSYETPDYDKFDVNSNVSVLKSNAREIDVDQIRDMLDKKYRDNLPKRKSIELPRIEEEFEKDPLEDTKEYDLNSILSKVKDEKIINYDKERLNKTASSEELINKINEKYGHNDLDDDEDELKELINTITALELKNQSNDAELLGLDANEDDTIVSKNTSIIEKKPEQDFYTGQLAVTDDDFEDFKDMQDDIKSNTVFVKILAFVFIVVLIAAIVFVANSVFDLGLF